MRFQLISSKSAALFSAADEYVPYMPQTVPECPQVRKSKNAIITPDIAANIESAPSQQDKQRHGGVLQ